MAFGPRALAAIAELQARILAHYPKATFVAERDFEDPAIVCIYATVDLEDRWEVIDLFSDRQTDLQVEDAIPIHIIPIRTPERERAVVAALRAERADAAAVEEHL